MFASHTCNHNNVTGHPPYINTSTVSPVIIRLYSTAPAALDNLFRVVLVHPFSLHVQEPGLLLHTMRP